MDTWNSLAQSSSAALGPWLPRVAAALAIVLLAWLLASIARAAVRRLLAAARLEERLQSPGLAASLAGIAYGLVWLFALPALLGTLGLDGLLLPVNAMMARLLSFLPNLVGAVAIFAIGFLAARILRQAIGGLLQAAGSERLAARIGLATALGKNTLAGLAGSAVFVLVLLPTVSAALQALGLDGVAQPVLHLLDTVIALLPRLLSAALIVAIGAVLGRVLAGLVTAVVGGAGLDRLLAGAGLGANFRIAGRDLSELVGGAVMVGVLLLAVTQACQVLGFDVLTQAVAGLGGVLARLAVAVVVFAVGFWLALLAARSIAASTAPQAKLLGRAAQIGIVFFSAALALSQAGLPGDIVAIAFGAVMGALALAAALALGLGGRRAAAKWLDASAASLAPAVVVMADTPTETHSERRAL